MLPPLLLAARAHHRVLDVCAAPGSKTRQLLEALAGPEAGPEEAGADARGLVVANDANAKRCETMVHQLRGVGAHKARAPPACPPAAPARPARPG
jgi:multisite-specific tRNA:(cytosine-C5)-methyltransferase